MSTATDAPVLRDDATIHALLEAVPVGENYGPFWATSDGQRLYAALHDRLGVPLAAAFRAKHGHRFEPSDIINTSVVMLSQPFILESILRAKNPCGYLWVCLSREMRKHYTSAGATHLDPALDIADVVDEEPLVPVNDATKATIDALTSFTPSEFHQAIPTIVEWLVERGHQSKSKLFTEAAINDSLLRLGTGRGHILAVCNAVLGSRRGTGEGSILGGFLLNLDWDPMQSPGSRAALRQYGNRMAAATEVVSTVPQMMAV